MDPDELVEWWRGLVKLFRAGSLEMLEIARGPRRPRKQFDVP